MTRPGKKSQRKWDSNPRSSALEADALTTRPKRPLARNRGKDTVEKCGVTGTFGVFVLYAGPMVQEHLHQVDRPILTGIHQWCPVHTHVHTISITIWSLRACNTPILTGIHQWCPVHTHPHHQHYHLVTWGLQYTHPDRHISVVSCTHTSIPSVVSCTHTSTPSVVFCTHTSTPSALSSGHLGPAIHPS